MNFCAAKFISFVAFEQLNMPTPFPPFRSCAARSPSAARSSASDQVAVRRAPFSRTSGSVRRTWPFLIARSFPLLPALQSLIGRSASAWRGGLSPGRPGKAESLRGEGPYAGQNSLLGRRLLVPARPGHHGGRTHLRRPQPGHGPRRGTQLGRLRRGCPRVAHPVRRGRGADHLAPPEEPDRLDLHDHGDRVLALSDRLRLRPSTRSSPTRAPCPEPSLRSR